MSVTKWGRDDGACGTLNDDILHAAICRLVDERRHGRRRRGQRQRQRLAPGPGGLQRGDHGVGARRHRRQARRPGRPSLLLVGHVRRRRHVRRLQQLRLGRRPDRARQVHLVDRARRQVRVHVRDVDGRAARDRRGGAPEGDPAVLHARPRSRRPSSTSARSNWKTIDATRTRPTRSCSTSRRSGRAATSA